MSSSVYETGTVRATSACVVRGWLYATFLFLLALGLSGVIDLRHDFVASMFLAVSTLGFGLASFIAFWHYRRVVIAWRHRRQQRSLAMKDPETKFWPFGS